MQVIGLCRFSYPAIGGFQIAHRSITDRENYLFHPDRMEEKFRSFEALTLPSIRAQTDPDFTLLIVTGDRLPAPYASRLAQLTADIPQIAIKPLAPEQHRPAMRKVINAARQSSDAPCLQFRLDDDDAIACDFVALLRETAQDASNLIAKHGRMAFDFNQGYLVRPGPAGLTAAPICKPFLTAGLGVVFPGDDLKTVMNFGHHKLHEDMTCISLTGQDMFLRGIGDHNDSAGKFRFDASTFATLKPASERHIKTRFGVDCDDIRRIYSAVSKS